MRSKRRLELLQAAAQVLGHRYRCQGLHVHGHAGEAGSGPDLGLLCHPHDMVEHGGGSADTRHLDGHGQHVAVTEGLHELALDLHCRKAQILLLDEGMVTRLLDFVSVKGKEEGSSVYELLGEESEVDPTLLPDIHLADYFSTVPETYLVDPQTLESSW